jgi:hypothetical protein
VIDTLLSIFGVTFLICDSALLERPRLWLCRWDLLRGLLSCYFCTGFWVSLFVFTYLNSETLPQGAVQVVLYAFEGATAAYLLDAAVSALPLSSSSSDLGFEEQSE